jgi:hypothetical protein
MLKPRTGNLWLKIHPHMKYLGGTADFDLWYRDDKSADPPPPNGDILPYLRVVRVKMMSMPPISPSWDDFRLPLYLNVEIGSSLSPEERRLAGRWNDIQLTHEQLDEITLYLRCFAPWALEEETSDV